MAPPAPSFGETAGPPIYFDFIHAKLEIHKAVRYQGTIRLRSGRSSNPVDPALPIFVHASLHRTARPEIRSNGRSAIPCTFNTSKLAIHKAMVPRNQRWQLM
jgi:hypothetical protein